MSKTFIVNYAYGFNPKTCEVDYVCRMRSLATLRILKKIPDAYIVLSAGMKEMTGNCGPLADIMENFLIQHGVSPDKIHKNPIGNNTLSETIASYEIIKKYGGGKVIFTTSFFHAPRVWLIWFFLYGIIAKPYTTKLKSPKGEWFSEFKKIFRDIGRIIFRKIVF